MAAAMRVLVVQNAPLEGPGRLAVALSERAVPFDVVRAWTEPVPPLPPHGALVVLGGPMGAYESDAHPFLEREVALIRAYAAAERPVLGVCLGAQLAAHALGGRAFPGTAGYEAGWTPVTLTDAGRRDPVVAALAAAPGVFHYHGDTFVPPPGAALLASTPRYAEQAFRLGSVLAFQFHVEATPETAAAWIQHDEKWLASRDVDPVLAARAPAGAAAGLDRVLERVAAFLDT